MRLNEGIWRGGGGISFEKSRNRRQREQASQTLQKSGVNRSGDATWAYLCRRYEIEEKSLAVELPADFAFRDLGKGRKSATRTVKRATRKHEVARGGMGYLQTQR